MHDGGRREQHVAGIPKVADRLVEDPFASNHVTGVESHGQESYQSVGKCQRHHEKIGGDL